MRKELRKNFGVAVKLLDKMQRSVLVDRNDCFGSNQINFVRNIDIACGRLEEAINVIFEDCKDVVEDVVMTMMKQDYDDLYRTFRDNKEIKPRGLCFEFDCGEKAGRKIYNIVVRFDEISDSIFVYVRRWYMRGDKMMGTYIRNYYDCPAYDKQGYFKNWIYSWGEKRWVDLKCDGYTYNPEEPVLEEPVFKKIPLK